MDPIEPAQAAQWLKNGQLLGLPTETVYGLAADADNPQAVAKIFAAKGRPADHPLIVHVAHAHSAAALAHYASDLPELAQCLFQAFWPGPLTLIVPRRAGVAQQAAAAQPSIGLRCPAHPVAQAVLEAAWGLGVLGLAAPSANRFGRVSPTRADHVRAEFGPDLPVIDGGACSVGIESTIVDCSRGRPVLLRPGQVSRAALESVCACPVLDALQDASDLATLSPAPRAPGTLASHYAPQARVHLLAWPELLQALKTRAASATLAAKSWPHEMNHPLLGLYLRAAEPGPLTPLQLVLRRMPSEPGAAAYELFEVLRQFDAERVTDIYVQAPPADAAWDGVRDRLSRASA
jgi:L-threonylcarbamoyladenylate synthase